MRVALHGARVDYDLGGVLVADDEQLERVVGVDECRVGGKGCGACVHHHVCVVCANFVGGL